FRVIFRPPSSEGGWATEHPVSESRQVYSYELADKMPGNCAAPLRIRPAARAPAGRAACSQPGTRLVQVLRTTLDRPVVPTAPGTLLLVPDSVVDTPGMQATRHSKIELRILCRPELTRPVGEDHDACSRSTGWSVYSELNNREKGANSCSVVVISS